MIEARLDVLPAAQRRLLPKLKPSIGLGFVLYGGTAIALRLGHRVSVDFDFFTDRSLDKTAIRAAFTFARRAKLLQDEPDALSLLVPSPGSDDGVKVSFFGPVRYGRVGTPDAVESIVVASLDDLMATKLKTIQQRIESKDYADIAAMLRSGTSLAKGLAAASLFYGAGFAPRECLRAMTFFKGGDLERLDAADKEVLIAHAAQIIDLPRLRRKSMRLSPGLPALGSEGRNI